MVEKKADDWPDDYVHRAARDIIDHLNGSRAGTLTKPARQAVRKALDAADAPATGRRAADEGLGRARRW